MSTLYKVFDLRKELHLLPVGEQVSDEEHDLVIECACRPVLVNEAELRVKTSELPKWAHRYREACLQ